MCVLSSAVVHTNVLSDEHWHDILLILIWKAAQIYRLGRNSRNYKSLCVICCICMCLQPNLHVNFISHVLTCWWGRIYIQRIWGLVITNRAFSRRFYPKRLTSVNTHIESQPCKATASLSGAVKCLAQGHIDTQLGGAGGWTSNLSVTRQLLYLLS
jgi:hypothetical protein